VLVDCLSLWLTGVIDAACPQWDDREALTTAAEAAIKDLHAAIESCPATVLLVSNEIGMGVVPATPSGRIFVDLLGRAHQEIAASCDSVTLMVAGRALETDGRHGR
jgi:adenosylcobinamide kinase/adenosylcobinamide-phosphate guanylyltransferase